MVIKLQNFPSLGYPFLRTFYRVLCFIALVHPTYGFTQSDTARYSVRVLQDSAELSVTEGRVYLRNAPFQLEITLNSLDGVFMSASFAQEYFSLGDSLPIPDFNYLNAKTRAEHPFNSDRELPLDGETVSFLFYDPQYDWHRFDEDIRIDESRVTGTKSVNQLYVEASGEIIPLNDFEGRVYLFFVATTPWPELGVAPRELGRVRLELVFSKS